MKSICKSVLCLFMVVSAASCINKERRALQLIDTIMFQTLADFDSYQPISTEIDTVFDIPYFRKEILDLADKTADTYKEMNEIEHRANVQLSIARASFFGGDDHLARAEEHLETLKKLAPKLEMQIDSIQMLASQCTGKPDRWGFRHKYRFRDNNGNAKFGELYMVTDKEVTQSLFLKFQDDQLFEKACKIIGAVDTLSNTYRLPSPVK